MAKWTVISTKDEASWLDDYINDVIANAPPALPPHDQRIGHVETYWEQVGPGLVYVAAHPEQGTPADRLYAQQVVYAQLAPFGYKLAGSFGVSPKVQADANRIIQAGGVHLENNSQQYVSANVDGDGTDNNGEPDTHKVQIYFQDPAKPQSPTGVFCDCQWGQFMNTPRTREWRRFQSPTGMPVPCKHVIATYYVSQSVPKDESRAPGDFGQEGQMALPGMPGGGEAPSSMGLMQRSENPNPNAWFMQPGAPPNPWNQQMQSPGLNNQMAMPTQPQQGFAPPPPESVLPQFPMEDMQEPMLPQVNPASVPGGRPGPTPTNPLQYPGGTFSHVAAQQFQNGDIVILKQDTMGQYVGRPESGMPGQKVDIMKGQSGHVRGTHPSTGMVEVLFMNDQFEDFGQLEPFGAVAWCWPSELKYVSPSAPGAATKRLW